MYRGGGKEARVLLTTLNSVFCKQYGVNERTSKTLLEANRNHKI